ncbi:prenyltransferase/squalene oxidase repeat-containing protein [Flavobacterium sp.]|uniref:prenyltransferase/squalene oxidase repeat-containing protein n=1 Tax=Flavobacterium sp. TaxID=239 RepID=UPI0037883DD9
MTQKFTQYIQNLSISNTFKSVILDEDFINSNPAYYQNYPSLFAKVFTIQERELELLNIAGYLYYQATIYTDSLLDEKDVSKFPLISICQEESIKILTSVFGLQSDFWKLWNTRRNEFIEAIYFEKSLLKKEIVTIYEYENLADKKAAFGKVAIDCLFSIDSKNISLYEQLLLSHKYFSVAFQLNDDIQDLKADVQKGQFNWAYYLLKQENITEQEPEILEKYLYVRGVAKNIYSLAISYCDKALQLVEKIEVTEWKKVLLETKKTFSIAIIEIDDYLEILTAEIKLSKDKIPTKNIGHSIYKATEFIKKNQNKEGSWREYKNQGGISNIWATAFILSKISEHKILKDSFENEISKALLFLENNLRFGLWSYNSTWIDDADSSNFALLSFCLNDKIISLEVIEKWLRFQNSKGGFSTYFDKNKLLTALDDKQINNVDGWLHTHNCVSAVSFYFLAKYNQKDSAFTKIKDYFDYDFEEKLNTYWWTSAIYTFYYLAKTYHLLNDNNKLMHLISLVKKEQNENGSFGDKYGENLFYTGMALEILLLVQKSATLEIEKTVGYLLQNQYDDGSWENSNALQVPKAMDIEPENTHYPVSSFGMNVRAKEFNRLFTTVSVLQALSGYESK